jgi:excisionase family DNA binding protein
MNDHASYNGHESDLLTVPETAKLLRISRNLAYELVARRELPCVRLGRVIRVPRASLDAWIASQAASGIADAALGSESRSRQQRLM